MVRYPNWFIDYFLFPLYTSHIKFLPPLILREVLIVNDSSLSQLNFIYIIFLSQLFKLKLRLLAAPQLLKTLATILKKFPRLLHPRLRPVPKSSCTDAPCPNARRSRLRKPTSAHVPSPVPCACMLRTVPMTVFAWVSNPECKPLSWSEFWARAFVVFVLKSSTVLPSRPHLHECRSLDNPILVNCTYSHMRKFRNQSKQLDN